MTIVNDVTKLIGNTPMVKINNILTNNVSIYAKLESFNPLSSVKDRLALAMIETGERLGQINKDSILVEPTSGNTGIGLAYISAVKGYKLILTMPDTMSMERRKLLKIFGAEIVLTPGSKGMKGAIEKAEEIVKSNSNAFMFQQFKNPANPEIHRKTTAEEIWIEAEGKLDFFVAGVGTGGTITGVGEVLKKYNKKIKIIAVEPWSSSVLSGKLSGSHKIQGIGAGFIPEILNKKIIDEIVRIKDDEAGEMARLLAKKEGLLVGISSGAVMKAGMNLALRPENQGKKIVVLFPDSGERYLSTWLFDD